MSKFEEICQIYAKSRQEFSNSQHSCQDFADFLVNRMSLYFGCPVETREMQFDKDAYLHVPIYITFYTNPVNPQESQTDLIDMCFLIRKKPTGFTVSYLPYSGDFEIPNDNLNKLDDFFDYIEKWLKEHYQKKLQIFRGEASPFSCEYF
jgi:hypothetical protein